MPIQRAQLYNKDTTNTIFVVFYSFFALFFASPFIPVSIVTIEIMQTIIQFDFLCSLRGKKWYDISINLMMTCYFGATVKAMIGRLIFWIFF